MNGVWIDIFKAGTHTDSSGVTRPFTTDQIDEMVTAFEATKGEYKPVFRIGGHDGGVSPAGGRLVGLERAGDVLRGCVDAAPVVREAIKNRFYEGVSSGIKLAAKVGDKVFPTFLDHVALLGHKIPAVKGLNGPHGLAALFGDQDDGGVAIFTFTTEEDEVELKEQLLAEERKNIELTDKLAKAEANFATVEQKHTTAITALETKYRAELDAAKAKVAEFEQAAAKAEVEAIVDAGVRGGRVSAAQRDSQVKLGLAMRSNANFSEGDSEFATWKGTIEKAEKVFNFEEKAAAGGDEGKSKDEAEFAQGAEMAKKHSRNAGAEKK